MTARHAHPVRHDDQLRATLLTRRPALANAADQLDDIVAVATQVARDRLSGVLAITAIRPGDVDDCGFLTAAARQRLLDLAATGHAPATRTGRSPGDAVDPHANWRHPPTSSTGRTLDQITAEVSGLHFAKETLTAGEREILTLAEALLGQLHALHGGYARTLLSTAEAAAVAPAVRDVLTRRPR